LEAATFQVTYQGKIITTALFSVVLLRQKLSDMKWLALLYLTFGVAAVQVSSSSSPSSPSSQGSSAAGFLAVAVACVLSGIAGVYFEMVLKRSSSASLWLRNIQLSVASLAIALFGTLARDWPAIREHGFFQGYDLLVVTTILLQACGGLIVAVVIKYADNVAKGFATSLSVIVSTVVSVFFFNLTVTLYFLEGAALVLIATYLYSLPDKDTKVRALCGGTSYADIGTDDLSQTYRSSHEENSTDDGYLSDSVDRSLHKGTEYEKA
jgi:UDP-sugar transporter A1/2/3